MWSTLGHIYWCLTKHQTTRALKNGGKSPRIIKLGSRREDQGNSQARSQPDWGEKNPYDCREANRTGRRSSRTTIRVCLHTPRASPSPILSAPQLSHIKTAFSSSSFFFSRVGSPRFPRISTWPYLIWVLTCQATTSQQISHFLKIFEHNHSVDCPTFSLLLLIPWIMVSMLS